MGVQFIDTPGGRMAVLPEDDYRKLLEAAEDAADIAIVDRIRQQIAAGEEEYVPDSVVKRLIDDDENPVRVWREYRGLSVKQLAEKAGLAAPYVSQIESGKRKGTVETIKAIAAALNLTIDDLV